jgi:hypothetical protein
MAKCLYATCTYYIYMYYENNTARADYLQQNYPSNLCLLISKYYTVKVLFLT